MIGQSLTLPNGRILKNRLVKSAMSEALGDAHNDPTDGLIDLYGRWGRSGAALLITGNTPVDRWHLEHAGNVVLDARSNMDSVRRLAVAGKSGGALILAQLAHGGRQVPEAINPTPLSMSSIGLELPGYGTPRTATEAELEDAIQKFVISSLIANEAGFDGVEIHSAHGYLLSSSLSPRTNRRADPWGGSLENRARLTLSVVRAVRAQLGANFIIGVKLNSSDFQKGGFSDNDCVGVAKMLESEGVDFLEISGGTFETPAAYQYQSLKGSTIAREAYFLDYARNVKRALNIPVMVTGGFRSLEIMNSALSQGATDLIGVGRPFIIDPEFPTKLLNGSTKAAPAVERGFPPCNELPRGAALNWFCHQLALLGRTGNTDLMIDITEGHWQYLADIEAATRTLLRLRSGQG